PRLVKRKIENPDSLERRAHCSLLCDLRVSLPRVDGPWYDVAHGGHKRQAPVRRGGAEVPAERLTSDGAARDALDLERAGRDGLAKGLRDARLPRLRPGGARPRL